MKKRILSVLIALVMAVGMISAAATAVFAADDGTWDYNQDSTQYIYVDFSPFTDNSADGSKDNPYRISSAAQLAGLAVLVNECGNGDPVTLGGIDESSAKPQDFANKYIKLTANIDLSAHEWVPIGIGVTNAFKGNFDGAGHSISGLKIGSESAPNKKYSSAGLFGYVENATIKNLGVSGEIYTDASNTSNSSAGGFVGHSSGATTITNCYNLCTVSCRSVGGFVGSAQGALTMKNCYNAGIVSSSTNEGGLIGGIAADANTELDCCYYNSGKAIGNRVYSGSTQKLSQSQMQGLAGATESSWENISIINKHGSLVDALNQYVYNNSTETLSPWHIHEGNYPVFGYLSSDSAPITYTYINDGTHSFKCTVCGTVTEEHTTTKPATCFTKAICALCDKEYGTKDKSNHDTSLVYDRNGKVVTEKNDGEEYYGEDGYNKNGFCAGGCYQPATQNAEGYYEIGNAGQLFWFADKVNNDNTNFGSANAKLTANIVVNAGVMTAESTGARVWTPIGNNTNKYSGTFEGNEHTVSGLYFNDSSVEYVGLFGYVGEGGTVENVGVVDSYIYGNSYAGGVVGYNRGSVLNCYNTGSVSGTSNFVGGVVGYNDYSCTVKNCYNTGSVSGTSNFVGGVVGYNFSSTVSNCYNTGNVSGGFYVGGMVGYNISGTVSNCYNTGSVSGDFYVGGVVGFNTTDASGENSCTVSNCYNTGSASGNQYVGGVVGYNSSSTVLNCYYLADIETDSFDGTTAKTSAQFASGEVAYLLGEAWGQTIGMDTSPVFKTAANTVYKNQTGGCSAATYKYEYSNTQKDPVTTHDENNYTYANGSIVNTITATCGDCQTNWHVTLKAPENAVYNGQLQGATVEGAIPGIEVIVNYNTINQPIDAGTYTASVTLDSVTVTVEYKIAQKVLTPDIIGRVTKVYDGTNTVPAGLTVVLDGIVGADDIRATSAVYTFDRPDAGTKKVNAECILLAGADVGNYTLSANTASADVGEITKAPSVTLTAPAAISGLVYDQQAHLLVTPGVTQHGTVVYSLDSMNWSTSVPTAVNAGKYTVFYKIVGDQNHLDSAPAVITVTVAQREIGIIWGQTAFEYNGERHAPTATATGVLPGDVCTVGTNGWGVYDGTYTITAITLSNPNYKLPSSGTSCQFTITTDYDKEADKVMDAVGDAINDAANEVFEDYIVPAISNAFNEMLENLFKMFQNLFN